MSVDRTQDQGGQERRRAREMSLQRRLPPADVPGYRPERLLGVGAYGEVWVAVEENTGRRVAIKFYSHRGGLDWSLLSREVEKLRFLSADRYVVQLIGVGWDSDPPYYVMEYLERGSLADRLQHQTLPVGEAVRVFRDVAIGLVHAHGKGVLHCDLKPANILLDQDEKPRLADFGQSRLSREQAPALGTLFYMAPEQADLRAVPDARWDVYALGALLYCML
ncbi:MAG TPA: serine/threonine protein kinase, partial [Planctomycetes bacterium]|nr:serine/threonine protein kinase [Planctomycetota bacterium]